MALNYGTTAIPSDNYSVVSGGTVDISVAFEASVGVIGGMDTGNGSATPGDVVEVTSPSDAQSKFGDGSELHEAVKIIFNNGAATVHALPVSETSTTENAVGTSGTLSNVPVMDPNIHDEHSIDFVDTGGTNPSTTITYDDPANLTLGTDEAAVNPVDGKFEVDAAAAGQYDVSYTYGDYSTSVINKLLGEEPRIVCVLSESSSVINDVMAEVNADDDDFVFMHVVAGAAPFADSSSPDTAGYTDSQDEERLSLVASSRGFINDAEDDMHRTMSGVAGYLASLDIGLSSTNDDIDGYTALRTDLTPSGASNLIDEQVMPLIDYPPVTIVKDMTTSTTTRFERVYTMQIVDEITTLSHDISRNFVGEQQTENERNQLGRSHRNMLKAARDQSPPLLTDYTVSVQQNSSNDNQTDIEIGLGVVGVMDTIDVTITVGDIVRNTS